MTVTRVALLMTPVDTDNSSARAPIRRLVRWLLLLAGALAVPILPLLVLGLSFEHEIEQQLSVTMTASNRFGMVVGLLSSDLLLPVPSSAVSTYGGGRLGFGPALLASWLGMTIGGFLGYFCGRWIGEPLAKRLVAPDDYQAMRRFLARQGALTIFITRPLPILAEAALLLTGLGRLALWKFTASLVMANFVVSAIYAAFGTLLQSNGALPAAILVSAVVPLLIALLVRRFLQSSTKAKTMRITINGEPREIPAGHNLASLLEELGRRPELCAVERNEELVPRAHHAACELAEGDHLEIVTLVGGG